MKIESERPEHIDAIHRLHVDAFPDDGEAKLVDALRDDGDAVISLVCTDGTAVVGHVLFSAMTAPFRALALAPVAVAESHQRRGIAAQLISKGVELAGTQGWDAVFVLGEPEYYRRFGFSADEARGYESPYAGKYFMMLDLTNAGLPSKSGRVDHARAFDGLG